MIHRINMVVQRETMRPLYFFLAGCRETIGCVCLIVHKCFIQLFKLKILFLHFLLITLETHNKQTLTCIFMYECRNRIVMKIIWITVESIYSYSLANVLRIWIIIYMILKIDHPNTSVKSLLGHTLHPAKTNRFV